MNINPIRLIGSWDEGWAMDKHTISSQYTGVDMYGHDTYSNVRSDLGELLYHFKYRGQYDNLYRIIDLIDPFLDRWNIMPDVDTIIPVPPTKIRKYQPAEEIACAIAHRYGIRFNKDILKKLSNVESKNMKNYDEVLEEMFMATKRAKKEQNILLVDDLYSSGRTLNGCVNILKKDPNVLKIFVLTMTKTR